MGRTDLWTVGCMKPVESGNVSGMGEFPISETEIRPCKVSQEPVTTTGYIGLVLIGISERV